MCNPRNIFETRSISDSFCLLEFHRIWRSNTRDICAMIEIQSESQATGKILRICYHLPTVRSRSRQFAAMRRILESHKRCVRTRWSKFSQTHLQYPINFNTAIIPTYPIAHNIDFPPLRPLRSFSPHPASVSLILVHFIIFSLFLFILIAPGSATFFFFRL